MFGLYFEAYPWYLYDENGLKLDNSTKFQNKDEHAMSLNHNQKNY